jgi:hypothetical protein
MLSNSNMLVTTYFLVWILTETRNYILLVYMGSPIFCEWEMLNLIISTSVMGNSNPNPTRYKTERCTGGMHWTCALERYAEWVYWADASAYKYTPIYSLSRSLIRKEKKLSLLPEREKERKDTLSRLKKIKPMKNVRFPISACDFLQNQWYCCIHQNNFCTKFNEPTYKFYPLNITL